MADHQCLLLRIHLRQADAIDAAIAEIDAELGDCLAAFRDAATRLTTIPRGSTRSATLILAEAGTDMSRFPSDAHLIS
ncbi:hypothetical protein D9599_06565 [Roseomonas sp. KE2513]|nr:hypothetical protein [Roseomonas sp. KE2513]